MIATEMTSPANPIAQIRTVYLVFTASILDSKRVVMVSIRLRTLEPAKVLMNSESSWVSSVDSFRPWIASAGARICALRLVEVHSFDLQLDKVGGPRKMN